MLTNDLKYQMAFSKIDEDKFSTSEAAMKNVAGYIKKLLKPVMVTPNKTTRY